MNTKVKKSSGMVQTFLMDNVMLFVFLAFFICGLLFVDKFASIYNMKNYLKNCAPLLIASTGLTFVVLNGGIDFSITSVISFGSVIAAYLMVDSPLAGSPLCVPLTILIVLAIGAVFGCINGIAVSRLKMPSFVATLAMQLIGSGIAVWFGSVLFDGVVSLGGLPDSFRAIGGKGAFWLPVSCASVRTCVPAQPQASLSGAFAPGVFAACTALTASAVSRSRFACLTASSSYAAASRSIKRIASTGQTGRQLPSPSQ